MRIPDAVESMAMFAEQLRAARLLEHQPPFEA